MVGDEKVGRWSGGMVGDGKAGRWREEVSMRLYSSLIPRLELGSENDTQQSGMYLSC